MSSSREAEINALLDLLDDPDPKVYHSVRNRFIEIGAEVTSALEDAWSLSLDETYQKRIELILDDIAINHASNLAEFWLKNNSEDLLEGYIILTLFQYPNLNRASIIASIENITKNIWLEINNQLTSLEKIRIISHILFQILKFKPDNSTLENPKFYYLNKVLESKTYSKSSISLLFIIIAQKLQLPVFGILLKYQPLLCYVDATKDSLENISENNILFYVDAFNRGNILSKDGLKEIGNRLSEPASPREYLPVKPFQLILNTILHIENAEKANQNFKKAENLHHFYNFLVQKKGEQKNEFDIE